MRIWHIGASSSPHSVNGVSYKVWQIAREQAAQGHEVVMILASQPKEATWSFATDAGIEVLHAPVSMLEFDKRTLDLVLSQKPPFIVNFHSMFVAQHALLARRLRSRGISYVITPSGGLAPEVLKRNKHKKRAYSWILQQRYVQKAAGIVVTLPSESDNIYDYVANYTGLIRWIPNAIDAATLERSHWCLSEIPNSLVYLGRFDIEHKGLDMLVDVAKHLPAFQFDLYGKESVTSHRDLGRLFSQAGKNVSLNAPVFGEEKAAILSTASGYIQTSRWESFGNSIAEAMYIGLPCFIRQSMSIATLFEEHGLGCVLPDDPWKAAQLVNSGLSNREQLIEWSNRARKFAEQNFHPKVVSPRYLEFYKEAVESAGKSTTE